MKPVYESGKISFKTVKDISAAKKEPEWMLKHRIESLKIFFSKPMPSWGPELKIDLSRIIPFVRAENIKTRKWSEVPAYIKNTFEKLGIPEAERKFLAGAGAMYESEVIYRNLKKELEEKGVIFTDTDTALQEYPELMKKYFMKCVPASDNKFSALHGAMWSGGSFVYIPSGVQIEQPLQIYFLMNHPESGQFEHTIIVAEEGSQASYIEGCSAPRYSTSSLHSAVVEIYVGKGARVRYTSIQNWSKNIFNLNTKRAIVSENGIMEWISGTLGSGVTMLYPCSILQGKGARAEHLSISYAGKSQVKDTGAKVIHLAPETTSKINARSICSEGGRTVYRGLVKIGKGAANAKSSIRCDAMLMDKKSSSATFPVMNIGESSAIVTHEASAGKIQESQIFYLMSRGLSKEDATALVIRGFIEPIVKELSLEYAVEFNRLVEMELKGKGTVG